MNIRITDKGGLKPTFTQWDADRVLLISGCTSQPSLRFDNPELSRSIVVVAEADGSDWKCNVPNFMLQFSGPMIVSVFIQPDEGKTVFTARYAVQWAKKPQDYTYTENIGYTNWVQKTEEAQELLDDIEDLRDEIQTAVDTATSASEAAVAAAEDIDETVAAALQAAKDSGDFDGADGISPIATITEISGGHEVTIVDADGTKSFDVMDGEKGDDGVSPEVSIASITGGHAVTITDADHPTGQTFNVMDGAGGQDGQDAVVDATLSNAGEAADAAATGAVKAKVDRLDAETLAMWPEIGADAFRWIYGSYINDAGAVRTNKTNCARSTLYQASTGDLFQNCSPATVSVGGVDKGVYVTLHEYSYGTADFDNTPAWLRRTTSIASGATVVLGANTEYIQIVYSLDDGSIVLSDNKALLTSNFKMRVVKSAAEADDVDELMPSIFPDDLDMPLSICHRGIASAGATGNTIAAYEDAISKGWKYLETDIRHTSDDVWVLLHDSTVATGVNVADVTYAQALEYKPDLATLEDFLKLCKRALVYPVIENKLGSSTTEAEANAVWALAKDCGMEKRIIWLSSSLTGVKYFLKLNPYAPVIQTSASTYNGMDMSDPSSLSRPDACNYMTGKNKVIHQRLHSAIASGKQDNLIDYYHYWGIYAGVYGPTGEAVVSALSDRFDAVTTEVYPYTTEPRPSSGGGGSSVEPYTSNPAALGAASPGSSDKYARGDHVHAKPTYTKSDVGLGNVDNVQQYSSTNPPPYPVSSVNGQTGAVSLSIPSTASDVGAVAVAQGVSHAGEFCVVGSDGNITTMTMSVWQGGSF